VLLEAVCLQIIRHFYIVSMLLIAQLSRGTILNKIFADRVNAYKKDLLVEFRKLALESENVVSLAVGDPDFPTPKHITESAKKAMDEGYTHYTPPTGLPELREAIAEKLREDNGIEADPKSEVIVTAGCTPAMVGTILALVDHGDEVIVPDPTYQYPLLTKMAGGIPVAVPLKEENEFRINPRDIGKKITSRTKMIVLISPDNPTGSALRKEDLEEVAEIAVKHDLLVVSDEIYEKIIFEGRKHFSIVSFPGMEDRTITINGFSKSYCMTGWRIGYLTADKSLSSVIGKVTTSLTLSANAISQKAALAALTNRDIARTELQKMMEEYHKRRELFVNGLNKITGIKCLKPAGSIFAFPSIKFFGISSFDFAMHILRKGRVILYPGTVFGDGGEGYLRVSLAYSQEKIKEGLSRIREAVEELPIKA